MILLRIMVMHGKFEYTEYTDNYKITTIQRVRMNHLLVKANKSPKKDRNHLSIRKIMQQT